MALLGDADSFDLGTRRRCALGPALDLGGRRRQSGRHLEHLGRVLHQLLGHVEHGARGGDELEGRRLEVLDDLVAALLVHAPPLPPMNVISNRSPTIRAPATSRRRNESGRTTARRYGPTRTSSSPSRRPRSMSSRSTNGSSSGMTWPSGRRSMRTGSPACSAAAGSVS